MVRRGNDDVFQKAHTLNEPGMVPKLAKEVNRCNESHHFCGYAQNSHRNVQEKVDTDNSRNILPKGTRQIKLLTTVVNDMAIPEEIHLVIPPMRPVAFKIKANESQGVHPPGIWQGKHRPVLHHPLVAQDNNRQAHERLEGIGNTRTQARNRIGRTINLHAHPARSQGFDND